MGTLVKEFLPLKASRVFLLGIGLDSCSDMFASSITTNEMKEF